MRPFLLIFLTLSVVIAAAVMLAPLAPAQNGAAPGAAAQRDASAASGQKKQPQSEGFFDIIFSGGIVGVTIILVLLALSLLAVYLAVEQWMTLQRDELMPEGLAEEVQKLLLQSDVAGAQKLCRERPSLLSYVLLSGISEVDGGWPTVEKAMEDTTAEQSARLLRKVEYLSVIGNIAPMIGLLGTVIGMIFAFKELRDTQGAAGPGQLAGGIYQALVTTVGGLMVAIPSLAVFAVLRNRVDGLVAEAAYAAQHVFSPLKRRRGRSKQPAQPPAPPA